MVTFCKVTFRGLKLCAWSHAKCVSLLALGFTHQNGLSYQIFELEDSGLPQQGILPISAKKQQQGQPTEVWKKTIHTVHRHQAHFLKMVNAAGCLLATGEDAKEESFYDCS